MGSSKFVNRLNERYGRLVVIRKGPRVSSGSSWICKCDCGTEVIVAASNLKNGQKKCWKCSAESKRENLTDKIFGRLKVIEFEESRLSKPYWRCLCECGIEAVVSSQGLKSGQTQSCGCFGVERRRAATLKHGLSNHPLYDGWINMKQRCLNPDHKAYDRYGARGITVCERWMVFENFAEDMLPTWSRGMTIERVDVNGNYEPENCIWATRRQQSRNQERTIKVEVGGVLMTVPEAAEKYGINSHTLRQRWHRGYRGDDLVVVRHRN